MSHPCWVLLEHLDGDVSVLAVYLDHQLAQNALADLNATQGCQFTLEASEVTEHTPWVAPKD